MPSAPQTWSRPTRRPARGSACACSPARTGPSSSPSPARAGACTGPWTYPPERADQFDELYGRSRREDFLCLLAIHIETGAITGVFTISQIVRGAFQSAYLGYYAHERFAGQGLMREALEQVLDHAFGALGLHRIEANIQPGNAPSIALARGAGFRLEGFSPRYLLIGGQWRDHERYAITVDEHAAARAAAAKPPEPYGRPL